MSTLKWFHEEPYLTTFTAEVLSCTQGIGGWDVILDITCFYPTGGGQPCDLGTLGGAPVTDVRLDETTGEIVHTVAQPLSGEVTGNINWIRRYDHMLQHTGQHLLSAVFQHLLRAKTLSWHLGTSHSTVDLDVADLTQEQVDQVEQECNRMIASCLPVRVRVMDSQETAQLPLRSDPTVETDIRIVEIQDYDWCPCGGIHVRNTGELNLLKIKTWAAHKDGTRVEFLTGLRALEHYAELHRLTQNLSRVLSVGVSDIPAYLLRTQEEITSLRKQLRVATERLLEIEADELVAASPKLGGARIVRMVFAGRPLEEIRLLAVKVASRPHTVAVFGTKGAIPQIVLHRSPDLRLNMGEILREVLPLIGGKGGGSPLQAQGGGSRPQGLEPALDFAARRIADALE